MFRKNKKNDNKIVEKQTMSENVQLERTAQAMPAPQFMHPSYASYPAQAPTQLKAMDEFGRVYSPALYYCPLPNSQPVPVPIPSPIVQVTPIITPIAMVPYATQNQPLFQIEEE